MKLKKGLECFAWVILAAVLILVNAAAANADEFSGQEYLAAGKDAAASLQLGMQKHTFSDPGVRPAALQTA